MPVTPHKIQGYKAQIGYSTTSGGTFTNFASLQTVDITIKTDDIDASDHDGQGWKNKLPGMSEWSATAKKLYVENGVTTGNSDVDLLAAITGKTLLFFKLFPEVETAGGGGRVYTGQGYITNFKHAGQNNDAQAIDISITGDGPLATAAQ